MNRSAVLVFFLTQAGRNVVQVGLEGAGSLLQVVGDVSFQEGDPKLSLVHHADETAPGPTGHLPWTHTDPTQRHGSEKGSHRDRQNSIIP